MVSRPERAIRIADGRYPLVDGTGAFLQGARWNSPGRRVIYASESYAGALLETLVHSRIGKLPRHHMWIEIEIPHLFPSKPFAQQTCLDGMPSILPPPADSEIPGLRSNGPRFWLCLPSRHRGSNALS